MIEETVAKILKSDNLIEKKEDAVLKEVKKRQNLILSLPDDIKNLLVKIDGKNYLVNNHFKRASNSEFAGVKFSINEVQEKYNEQRD